MANRPGKDNKGYTSDCVHSAGSCQCSLVKAGTAWECRSRVHQGYKCHSVGFWLSAHMHAASALLLLLFSPLLGWECKHAMFFLTECCHKVSDQRKARYLMPIFMVSTRLSFCLLVHSHSPFISRDFSTITCTVKSIF